MKKLNLTPEEILDFKPNTEFEGYLPREVDEFLDKVMEDYDSFYEAIEVLKAKVVELEGQVSLLKQEKIELEGKQRVFDLSKTTQYSSVDILKRISRLEEEVYKK